MASSLSLSLSYHQYTCRYISIYTGIHGNALFLCVGGATRLWTGGPVSSTLPALWVSPCGAEDRWSRGGVREYRPPRPNGGAQIPRDSRWRAELNTDPAAYSFLQPFFFLVRRNKKKRQVCRIKPKKPKKKSIIEWRRAASSGPPTDTKERERGGCKWKWERKSDEKKSVFYCIYVRIKRHLSLRLHLFIYRSIYSWLRVFSVKKKEEKREKDKCTACFSTKVIYW